MLNVYLKEFMAITTYVFKDENTIRKKNFLYADKEFIKKLLSQNSYETTEKKLSMWRTLRWTETDVHRLTKRILVNGKAEARIAISLEVYEGFRVLVH